VHVTPEIRHPLEEVELPRFLDMQMPDETGDKSAELVNSAERMMSSRQLDSRFYQSGTSFFLFQKAYFLYLFKCLLTRDSQRGRKPKGALNNEVQNTRRTVEPGSTIIWSLDSRLPPHHRTKKCFNFHSARSSVSRSFPGPLDSLAHFGEWRKAAVPLDCGSVEDLKGPSQFAACPRKG